MITQIAKRSKYTSRKVPQRYKDCNRIQKLSLLKVEILIIGRLLVLLANFHTYFCIIIGHFIKYVFTAL